MLACTQRPALEYARIKKDAVPRFYDPSTKMIRSFLPPLPTDKPMEISWQSYVFYQEIFQIDETLAADDFNPAILGRLLMGLEGMIEYAHNVDYVFSTYFDPVTRQPLPYYENPGLGAVREPWTVGSHAFVMARAYDLTADSRYRKEASDSLNALLHTMRYTESNKYYNRTYTDPMDMPHSDLTGNAYGAVAAWKLFEQSGNARWQRTSRDFLNTLLRQTFWHEDRTDAVSRELRHAGLFYPYGGAPAPRRGKPAKQTSVWLGCWGTIPRTRSCRYCSSSPISTGSTPSISTPLSTDQRPELSVSNNGAMSDSISRLNLCTNWKTWPDRSAPEAQRRTWPATRSGTGGCMKRWPRPVTAP